jgi:hypothetical protein
VRSHVRFSKGVKGSFHRVESYHYIAWQSMKKEGATWAANAINSFHGWALISKDEAGPLDINWLF